MLSNSLVRVRPALAGGRLLAVASTQLLAQ